MDILPTTRTVNSRDPTSFDVGSGVVSSPVQDVAETATATGVVDRQLGLVPGDGAVLVVIEMAHGEVIRAANGLRQERLDFRDGLFDSSGGDMGSGVASPGR